MQPAFVTPISSRRARDEQEQALARVDALAAQAIGWVAPIQFGIAHNDAERHAAYRLRYQVVMERGWMQAQELSDGLERDEYDKRAVHILAWDGDMLAATARLVFPEPGLVLPTENAFDLVLEPRGRVVDAGRFVVVRAYSNSQHRLFAALLARAWLEVRARGYSHVSAAFASRSMLRLYRQLGARITILGEPRLYWGVERFPIRFDVAEAAPTLLERWLGHSDALTRW